MMMKKNLTILILLPVASILAQTNANGSSDDTAAAHHPGNLRQRRALGARKLCIFTDIAPDDDADWDHKCDVGDGRHVYEGKAAIMYVPSSGSNKQTYTLLPDSHYRVRNAGLSDYGESDVRENLRDSRWAQRKFPYTYCTANFDQHEFHNQVEPDHTYWEYSYSSMNGPKWAAKVFTEATGLYVSAKDRELNRFTVCKLGQSIMELNGDL